jgi:formimidoylglutamate deiminase
LTVCQVFIVEKMILTRGDIVASQYFVVHYAPHTYSEHGMELFPFEEPVVRQQGTALVLPGLATVHSHAFQRALRGRTQRRSTAAASFWSWRGLMFALAERITPETMFQLAFFAYVELAQTGVTAVGEFHYLHHDRGGQPYADRLALAEAVIAAAHAAGLRITLIRAAYLRAGYQQELVAGQDRFYDPDVDLVLADLEALRKRYAADPLVRIGVAAHSIRAVPLDQTRMLVAYARAHGLPFHMHLAEQRRELTECETEYGTTPVALLANNKLLDERFVAIHATHLSAAEVAALGAARSFVGLCRTTERDLGDGTPALDGLLTAGARLCFGVDSHASGDAFEEIRAAELDIRSVAEARHVAAEAPRLLDAATRIGYEAIGWGAAWQQDRLYLHADDASVVGADPALLADAVIFGATPRAVERVVVNGHTIVEQGRHRRYDEALQGYRAALRELAL